MQGHCKISIGRILGRQHMKNLHSRGIFVVVGIEWGAIFFCSGRDCFAQSAPTFELPADFYPILPWDLPHWSAEAFSDPHHGLASLKECGFNTAAFVRPQHLAEAEKLGLKCILAPEK